MPDPVPVLLEAASPTAAPDEMLRAFTQMFELMGNWFGELHREQSARLRQELEQIVTINRELAEIHQRLAAAPAAPAPAAAEAPPAPEHEGGPEAALRGGPGPDTPPIDSRVHLDLLERIDALQREQQTRWRRMFGLVTGAR
jgi:hypothetical protein